MRHSGDACTTVEDNGRSRVNVHTTQVDDLQLIALPTALSCAEMFVRFTVTEWQLRPLADEATYVVRHLVSTAVDGTDPRSPGLLTVRLRLHGNYLTVEVEDEQSPRSASISPALANRQTSIIPLHRGGTLVRCEVPLPGGVNASAVPLPRRERRRSPAAAALPPEDDFEPQLMERILSSLGRAADRQRD
jgi:hypothetical protein